MDPPAPPSPVAPFAYLRSEAHKKTSANVFTALVASARREVLASVGHGRSEGGEPNGLLPSETLEDTNIIAPLRLRPLTVVVRKRPLNASERGRGEFDVLTVVPRPVHPGSPLSQGGCGSRLVVHEPRKRYDLTQSVHNTDFVFDRAYGEGIGTRALYADLLAPVIGALDRGLQATVFAYGQTGSGKSYSMGGLTEAALGDIFALARERGAAAAAASAAATGGGRSSSARSPPLPPFVLTFSYFEIYLSKVYDLLNDRAELSLREDAGGVVQVVGLTEHATASPTVTAALLAKGSKARSVGTTRVNADSSRSHSVIHCALRAVDGGSSGVGGLLGRLTLVDLAGSEAAADADPPDRITHREAADINKSLLALKECIRSMAKLQAQNDTMAADAAAASAGGATGGRRRSGSSKKRPSTAGPSSSSSARVSGSSKQQQHGGAFPHTHVPYRGSKLTQVLKDCFTSPGALTVMLATLGPSSASTEHTLNTLRYASRLKELGMAREASFHLPRPATATSSGGGGGASSPIRGRSMAAASPADSSTSGGNGRGSRSVSAASEGGRRKGSGVPEHSGGSLVAGKLPLAFPTAYGVGGVPGVSRNKPFWESGPSHDFSTAGSVGGGGGGGGSDEDDGPVFDSDAPPTTSFHSGPGEGRRRESIPAAAVAHLFPSRPTSATPSRQQPQQQSRPQSATSGGGGGGGGGGGRGVGRSSSVSAAATTAHMVWGVPGRAAVRGSGNGGGGGGSGGSSGAAALPPPPPPSRAVSSQQQRPASAAKRRPSAPTSQTNQTSSTFTSSSPPPQPLQTPPFLLLLLLP